MTKPQPKKSATSEYLILLDIKAIITKWQDLDINDVHAIDKIRSIIANYDKAIMTKWLTKETK
jgi:hypothetical protein